MVERLRGLLVDPRLYLYLPAARRPQRAGSLNPGRFRYNSHRSNDDLRNFGATLAPSAITKRASRSLPAAARLSHQDDYVWPPSLQPAP